MKSEAAKTQEYLDKFTETESFYEKGRIAAEMYSWLHQLSPADVKAEILKSAGADKDHFDGIVPEDRLEMDRGGLAWCDEQLH